MGLKFKARELSLGVAGCFSGWLRGRSGSKRCDFGIGRGPPTGIHTWMEKKEAQLHLMDCGVGSGAGTTWSLCLIVRSQDLFLKKNPTLRLLGPHNEIPSLRPQSPNLPQKTLNCPQTLEP